MNAQRARHREPPRKTPAGSVWFAPIVNSAAARELIPELVAQYLLAEGWRLKESSPISSLWSKATAQGDCDLFLPIETSYDDFGARMGELLQVLAAVEGRSPQAVYGDLRATSGSRRDTSRLVEPQPPRDHFELIGEVVQLQRRVGQRTGRATVLTTLGDRTQRVVLQLTEPNYQTAIAAHQHARPLRCVGTLVRRGRQVVLENPRDLLVDLD